jgi:hypothetical protein
VKIIPLLIRLKLVYLLSFKKTEVGKTGLIGNEKYKVSNVFMAYGLFII